MGDPESESESLSMSVPESASESVRGRRRPYDGRRRRAAAEESRAAMVAACRDVLFEQGYAAVTIKAVAGRAGVSAETVYKTFTNKAGLLKALWDVTLAGDAAPEAMADRPELRAVWAAADVREKVWLWAGFVCSVHGRLAGLADLLGQAGPDVTAVLNETEEERLRGVRAFTEHLARSIALTDEAEVRRRADGCWALTGSDLYIKLTGLRGWSADAYRDWLADQLTGLLLGGARGGAPYE